MEKFLVVGVMALVVILGAATYLGAAGTAIIYALGANDSPKNRRMVFDILGVVMIGAFICGMVYLTKNGWPL